MTVWTQRLRVVYLLFGGIVTANSLTFDLEGGSLNLSCYHKLDTTLSTTTPDTTILSKNIVTSWIQIISLDGYL